jgi:hypothetical protein
MDMKAIIGALAFMLVTSCATTWVDPHINLRNSQVRVECLSDPLGLGSKIENLLNEAGVGTKPSDSKAAGDLVLKVTYKFTKSDIGLYTIQSIKAEMLDLRYHSVEARYQWEGQGDSQTDTAQKLVNALVEQR